MSIDHTSASALPRAILSLAFAGGIVACSASEDNRTTEQDTSNVQTNAAQMQQPGPEQSSPKSKQGPELTQIDQNNDRGLGWSEIEAIYNRDLEQADWTEDYVFSTYDKDDDEVLNEEEYTEFVSGIAAETVDQADPPASDSATAGAPGDNNGPASAETAAEQMRFNEHSAAEGEDSNAMERATRNDGNQQTQHSGAVAIVDMTIEEIEERDVVSSSGEKLGQVEEVVTAPDGSISGIVVGVDGFWEVGKKDVFVPESQAKRVGERIVWQTELSEEELDDIPQHKSGKYSSLNLDE